MITTVVILVLLTLLVATDGPDPQDKGDLSEDVSPTSTLYPVQPPILCRT